jgi:hypothetical protein
MRVLAAIWNLYLLGLPVHFVSHSVLVFWTRPRRPFVPLGVVVVATLAVVWPVFYVAAAILVHRPELMERLDAHCRQRAKERSSHE